MKSMTMTELWEILVSCAGGTESPTAAGDVEDEEFETLGYDSLALLETTAHIGQRYGVSISEEQVALLRTPGELLKLVNAELVEAA